MNLSNQSLEFQTIYQNLNWSKFIGPKICLTLDKNYYVTNGDMMKITVNYFVYMCSFYLIILDGIVVLNLIASIVVLNHMIKVEIYNFNLFGD